MTTSRTFKIIAASMCFVVVLTGTYSPSKYVTPRAHAFLGIGDIVFEPILDVINQALNGLAWTVAKLTIQSLTRSTVNWINSGFNGSPAFISDLGENLQYLGDAVAEDLFVQLDRSVQNATGFNITSPFQDQINQKLREEYYRTTSGLLGLSEYDLSGRSTDPKAFLNGDFSKGGFNAYFSANGNPANNPFGAYRIATNELFRRIDGAAQKRKEELNWGRGILPWRGKCDTVPSAPDLAKATLPTSQDIADLTRSANAAIDGSGGGTTASPGLLSDETVADLNRTAAAESRGSVSLSKAEKCRNNPVRTPGAVIESQLELSLGTGIRQLELADSINEIVGALLGQLVNQVLGVAGLSGVAKPSSGGGSSYLDRATSVSQFDGVTSSLSNGVLQSIRTDQMNYQNVRSGWQKVLDAANRAEDRCGMKPEITDAKTRATEGIAKADASLQTSTELQAQVQAAAASTAVDKSMQITSVITSYQTALASPMTLGAIDISTAARESADTTKVDGVSPSLYSQMVEFQKSCNPITN